MKPAEAGPLGLLKAWEFGPVDARPRLLITGGVHGDEYEPIAAIQELAESLRGVPLRGRLTLIPVVNEAAYRVGSRAAEDGLDLARTCPGRALGSITERVADALSTWIRGSDAYIDLHSGGRNLRLLPLSGYMLHPDPAILDQQRRLARAFGLPIIWGTDPKLEGRSLSVARDAGVPAIYAEYGGGGDCDPNGVAAYVQGCRNVLAELDLIDGKPVRPRQESWIIEDDRPGSGHLQSQHPSPGAGVFRAEVRLGDQVNRGGKIGRLIEPESGESTEIRAERSGIVLGLRAFAKVEAGEALAIVLEVVADGPARPKEKI